MIFHRKPLLQATPGNTIRPSPQVQENPRPMVQTPIAKNLKRKKKMKKNERKKKQ
jgi:hypothetical protein